MNWPACRFEVVHDLAIGNTRDSSPALATSCDDRRHRHERILLEIAVFEHDVDRRVAVRADEAVAVVVERQAELADAGDGFALAA